MALRQIVEALIYGAIIALGGAVSGLVMDGDWARPSIVYLFTVCALERGRVLRYMRIVQLTAAEIRRVLAIPTAWTPR